MHSCIYKGPVGAIVYTMYIQCIYCMVWTLVYTRHNPRAGSSILAGATVHGVWLSAILANRKYGELGGCYLQRNCTGLCMGRCTRRQHVHSSPAVDASFSLSVHQNVIPFNGPPGSKLDSLL
jgi:hypothetical protein